MRLCMWMPPSRRVRIVLGFSAGGEHVFFCFEECLLFGRSS